MRQNVTCHSLYTRINGHWAITDITVISVEIYLCYNYTLQLDIFIWLNFFPVVGINNTNADVGWGCVMCGERFQNLYSINSLIKYEISEVYIKPHWFLLLLLISILLMHYSGVPCLFFWHFKYVLKHFFATGHFTTLAACGLYISSTKREGHWERPYTR